MQSFLRCAQKSLTLKYQEIVAVMCAQSLTLKCQENAIVTMMYAEISHIEVTGKCNRNRGARRNLSHESFRKMQSLPRCAQKPLTLKRQ